MFDKADSDIKGFGVTYNHYTLYVSGAGSNVETPVETDSNIKTVETAGLDAWRGRKKRKRKRGTSQETLPIRVLGPIF